MGGGKKGERDASRNQCCFAQVLALGSDTSDTLPSVLVSFDNKRYLFNIGEGFQRYALQNKIKTAKIDGIFLTRATTEAAGGLPGTLLTLADKIGLETGTTAISAYGPRGMNAFANCLRTYVNIRDIQLSIEEVGSSGATEAAAGRHGLSKHTLIKNHVVDISSVVIEGASAAEKEEANGEGEGRGASGSNKRPRLDVGEEGASGARRGPGTPVASPKAGGGVDKQVAVSMFVVALGDIPGKFLPQKALELGVPKGPAFGKLCRGESVMSSFGRYVNPNEVMEGSKPGPTAVILDLPTLHHLKRLQVRRPNVCVCVCV